MFDSEPLIDLKTAAAIFPRVNDRPVHPRTVLNWMRTGVRGRRLESKVLGSKRVTSREAVNRFLDGINPVPVPAAG